MRRAGLERRIGWCARQGVAAPRHGSEDPARWRLEALTTFRELGVSSEIADALESEGIAEAFPIQALALPIALAGHDMIGQARTGTGKTLAFGVPLLQRIEHGGRLPQALVLVPTRELAIQVTDDLRKAGGKLGSRVLSVYGGRAYEPQIDALKEGVEVIVGTPGRLLDLVKQRYLDLSQIKVLVLDEADRMLDLGFLPDIERIVGLVPSQRQTMLFSATMPGEIVSLSRRYLNQPTNVRAESHAESEATPQVVQHVWQAHQMDKPEVLARILQARDRGLTMVFCQTKRACDRVAEELTKRGFAAAAVHGDLGQSQRERALRAFRAGKIDVLVATDVAARGLDVDDITHVVNYECPEDEKAYVHRIGRTGRAGKEGISVTLVDWNSLQRWKLINSALDLGLADPEEMYSTSEALYTAMDIPSGVTGTLPKEQRGRAGLAAEELEDIGETGRQRTQSERGRKRGRGDREAGAARGERDRSSGSRQRDEDDDRPPRRRQARARTRTRSGMPVDAQAMVEAETSAGTDQAPGTTVEAGTGGGAEAALSAEKGATGVAAQVESGAAEAVAADGRRSASRSRRRGSSRSGQRTGRAAADSAVGELKATADELTATVVEPKETVVEPKSTVGEPKASLGDPKATVVEPKSTIADRGEAVADPAAGERRVRRRTRGGRSTPGASENS